MNSTISILIVDDQALFREGLRTLISVQPDFKVVGEASSREEPCAWQSSTAGCVLMDLRMPILDGVSTTQRLREVLPDCRIIVLTTFDDA